MKPEQLRPIHELHSETRGVAMPHELSPQRLQDLENERDALQFLWESKNHLDNLKRLQRTRAIQREIDETEKFLSDSEQYKLLSTKELLNERNVVIKQIKQYHNDLDSFSRNQSGDYQKSPLR